MYAQKLNLRNVVDRNELARAFGWRVVLETYITQIKRDIETSANPSYDLTHELAAAETQLRCADVMDEVMRLSEGR